MPRGKTSCGRGSCAAGMTTLIMPLWTETRGSMSWSSGTGRRSGLMGRSRSGLAMGAMTVLGVLGL